MNRESKFVYPGSLTSAYKHTLIRAVFVFLSFINASVYAQSRNEVEIAIAFDGTEDSTTGAFPTDPLDDPAGLSGAHTPGLDGALNNRVVRLLDSYAVRVDWNINEAEAQNIILTVTLPDAVAPAGGILTASGSTIPASTTTASSTWNPDSSGNFSGCDPALSTISADGKTLVCHLNTRREGSHGSIRPVAKLDSGFDATEFDVNVTLTTADDAIGVSDELDTLFVVSEAPNVDYVKNRPLVSTRVTNISGEEGVVVLYPVSVIDFSQTPMEMIGLGPINDAVAVNFFDHAWGLTDSVRLATAAEMALAGFVGGVCDTFSQEGANAGAYLQHTGVANANGAPSAPAASFTCGAPLVATRPDLSTYPVIPISISGATTRPFPPTYSDNTANDPQAPTVVSGQIALWLSGTEIDAAIASPSNLGVGSATFDNSIANQDQTSLIDDRSDVEQIPGIGTSGPATTEDIENNTIGVAFGVVPQPVPGNESTGNSVTWLGGPLSLYEFSVGSTRAVMENVISGVPGAIQNLQGSSLNEEGRVNRITGESPIFIPEVPRASTLTLKGNFRAGTGTENTVLEPLVGCMAFDTSHYNIKALPAAIPVAQSAQNAQDAPNNPVVSSFTTEAPSDGLAHVAIGQVAGIRRSQLGSLAMALEDVNYVVEVSNEPTPTVTSGQVGITDDSLSCNDSDSGTSGWVDTKDSAALVVFDADGNGLYEGITRARVRVLDAANDWAPTIWDESVRQLPNGFDGFGHAIALYFQVEVLSDVNVQVANQELFAFSSHALDGLDASGNAKPTDCRPHLPTVWEASGNDVASATGWCNNTFVDDGVDSFDTSDNAAFDARSVTYTEFIGNDQDGLIDSSGVVARIVVAQPFLTKENVAGVSDVKDNGQLVQYKLTPQVFGAPQEALQGVIVTDFLDSRYEFVRFVDLPDTPGVSCQSFPQFGNQVRCIYPGSLPGGWPNGEPDPSFTVEVRVVGAIASLNSLTQIVNTAQMTSNAVVPYDPIAGIPEPGATPTPFNQTRFDQASSFLPVASSESEVVKSVNALEGVCDTHPTLDIDTFDAAELAAWQARCSLINLNGNMNFELSLKNDGNIAFSSSAIQRIEFIDVFPYNGDSTEPASNTPNQTGSPATIGDGRDPASDFSGNVSFVGVSTALVAPNDDLTNTSTFGGSTTTWVTGAAPNTISRDPTRALAEVAFCDAPGGAVQNAVVGTCPADNSAVTGVYIFIDGAPLNPGQTVSVSLELDTQGAECSDVWTNTFGARTPELLLPARSNDVSVMPNCVSVGSTIFRDLDNDAIQGPNEAGVDGVTVQLFAEGVDPTALGAVPIATTVSTVGTGEYQFDELIPGRYFVYIPIPPAALPVSSTDIASSGADNQIDGDDNGAQTTVGGPITSPVFELTRNGEPSGAAESGTNGDQDNPTVGFPGTIAVIDGSGDTTLDFGLVPNGSIGDLVFIDLDGNGVINSSDESGIGGVTVTLSYDDPDDPGTTITRTTVTGLDGSYSFDSLPLDVDYTVTVDTTTLPGVFGNDIRQSFDPDGGVSNQSMVRLDPGTPNNTAQDFGYIPLGTVGDTIWFDADRDGVQDATETGIGGVTVQLTPPAGVDIGGLGGPGSPITTTTDGNGQYLFDGIPVGTGYEVMVVTATGPLIALTQSGDPDAVLDNTSTVDLALNPLDNTEVIGNLNQDFGYSAPVSLGGFIWEDRNLDGIQELGANPDPAIPGSIVSLVDINGDPVTGFDGVTPVDPITVGPSGEYLFVDLSPGDYRVRVTRPAGFSPTLVQNTNADDDVVDDSNIAAEPISDLFESGTITLASGTEPIEVGGFAGDDQDVAGDANGNVTVDFGFYQQLSLGSVVFDDLDTDGVVEASDGNGVQDTGEPGINGATVSLFRVDPANAANLIPVTVDANGVYQSVQTGVDNSVSTSALISGVAVPDGSYNFSNLPTGNYVIQVAPPSGFTPTNNQVANPENGQNLDSNIDTSVTGLVPGTFQSGVVILGVGDSPTGAAENDANAAAETDPSGTQDNNADLTVDFGFIRAYSVGSIAYQDANDDGDQDVGELGIAGVQVRLLDAAGNEIPVGPDGILGTADDAVGGVTTAANGRYNFSNLTAGEYQVEFTPPSDLVPSSVQVPDPDAAGPGQDVNGDSNLIIPTAPANSFRTGLFSLGEGSGADEPTIELDPDGVQEIDPSGNANQRSNLTVDAGFVVPVSLGSFIWQDLNQDGVQDLLEPGVEGAVVSLLVDDGTSTGNFIPARDINGDLVTSVTTGPDGQYNFSSLPVGDYKISVVAPASYIASPVQTTTDDDDAENDSNIAQELAGNTFESGVFTLESGQEPNESDNSTGDAQDGTSGSATDLSGNQTIDIGLVPTFSLGSFVWTDLNNDGLQDDSEAPLAGTQVALFVDDGSGNFVPARDVSNTLVPSVTTGADGLYLFDQLPAGDYRVELTPPANVFPSSIQNISNNSVLENDSNISAPSLSNTGSFDSIVVTLATGSAPNETGDNRGDDQDGVAGSGVNDLNGNMTLDFAFVPSASLGNYVWLDLDMDGVQDANESGIANVAVDLLVDSNGDGVVSGAELTTPVQTATTGANGEYLFSNLMPGTVYVVSVPSSSALDGLEQTYDEGPNAAVGTLDNTSDPIVLEPGEAHLTADFGYGPRSNVGTIGDRIWVDANDDGVQDPGEPGIPGVTVTLLPAPTVDLGNGPGVAIDTVTTTDGRYLFTDLPLDGTYVVSVGSGVPAGYTPTNLGDPDVFDGNSNVADQQTIVVLTSDDPVNLDADFGYIPEASQNNSIGDTVWKDLNRDGVIDANESRIAGVTVTLLDESGLPFATTTTDNNGMYLFTGVPDATSATGTYTVVVSDQSGVLVGLEQTFDSDDGIGPIFATPNSSVVTGLGFGVDTPVSDLDQDFGFVETASGTGTGSIGDTIFLDADGSGSADAGEGLEGVRVNLFGPGPDGIIGNGDDVLIASTTTDVNGNYSFTGLSTQNTGPDTGTDYRVEVDTSSLPNGGDGLNNSVDPNGGGDSNSVVTLTAATPNNDDQDFGYSSDDMNSASGTLWSDTDGDGSLAEAGRFVGVTIELRDQNGNVVQKTTTDMNGDYSFINLPDGIFTVVVTDENNVLNNFEHTDSPNGSGDTADSTSKDDTGYIIDLDSAGVSATPVSDNTGDFGYQASVTNPITLGEFLASVISVGSDGTTTILFSWSTQSEVSNLGFNLYENVNGQWQRVNDKVISAQGDSVSIQSYEYTAGSYSTIFALSDIDMTAEETLHGPFSIGIKYGVLSKRSIIDWKSERNERLEKRKTRLKARMKQQYESREKRQSQIER